MQKKRWGYLIICCFLMLFAFGCNKNEANDKENEITNTIVFKYGNNIVTKGEVYIYIHTIKDRYELQYGEDVWQLALPTEEGDVTMVELTKEAVVDEIIRVKTLSAHASDLEVALTDAQNEEIKKRAEDFFNGLTDEDKREMELTEDKVYQVMQENMLADLTEAKILEDNPIEISDEEARMTTFFDMYFHCYNISPEGNVIPFSEEDKQKQYENALQACSTLATASIDENEEAENIEKLAQYYKLEQAKEQTLSPTDILEIYGEDIYNLLYSMENGDYSTVIESEYGYHVFQMIELTDRKATNGRKDVMRQEAIKQQLSDTLEKWRNEIDKEFSYPESVNMEIYDTISLQ